MQEIDTRGILFICGGAFVGIDKIIKQRTGERSVGFHANVVDDTTARRFFSQQLRNVNDEATIDLLQRTSKPCPFCHVPISHYKGHGCHHIKPGGGCPSCHRHFCYICLHEYNGGCANRCPLFCNDNCGCPPCPDCRPGNSCNNCDGPRGMCQVCHS